MTPREPSSWDTEHDGPWPDEPERRMDLPFSGEYERADEQQGGAILYVGAALLIAFLVACLLYTHPELWP